MSFCQGPEMQSRFLRLRGSLGGFGPQWSRIWTRKLVQTDDSGVEDPTRPSADNEQIPSTDFPSIPRETNNLKSKVCWRPINRFIISQLGLSIQKWVISEDTFKNLWSTAKKVFSKVQRSSKMLITRKTMMNANSFIKSQKITDTDEDHKSQ